MQVIFTYKVGMTMDDFRCYLCKLCATFLQIILYDQAHLQEGID
jgi:hypothetical protein